MALYVDTTFTIKKYITLTSLGMLLVDMGKMIDLISRTFSQTKPTRGEAKGVTLSLFRASSTQIIDKYFHLSINKLKALSITFHINISVVRFNKIHQG
jgi:hypothetical protein